MRGIKGAGDVLFYSSPCTGGSSWQRINTEHARRVQCMSFAQKLVDHYDLHWKLWVGFERVARHCHAVGATVFLEWPRHCAYWREPRVVSFMQELGFTYADFDGC
eukprot:9981925-Prorocentrum_lima.AAC.1